MSIRDFRDIKIYQRSQSLLPIIQRLSLRIQKEQRELAKNLLKTACQIGPQIAEGYAKKSSSNEFKRYLDMAIGSTDEMIAHLEQVPLLVSSINKQSIETLISEYETIVKQLQVLKRNWK